MRHVALRHPMDQMHARFEGAHHACQAIAHLGKAIGMADRADATGRRVPGGSAAPSQRLTQLQVAYGNAAIAARGYGAPETTEAFARAREAASGDNNAPGQLAAELRPMGRRLRARRVDLDAGARGGFPTATSRQCPIRARPALRIRSKEPPISSRENISKRDIIWNARSRCSNLVATTIWPFASGMTLASRPWSICRWCYGPSAKSIERFRSSTACRRGWRAQAILVRMGWERRTRPCSN